MAYRFDGTSSIIECAPTPLVGYAYGAVTAAGFFKRNSVGARTTWLQLADTTLSIERIRARFETANTHIFFSGGGANAGGNFVYSSTSIWYLVAVTRASGTALPRFHVHDGTAWTHEAASSGTGGDSSVTVSSDRIRVGTEDSGLRFFPADLVCAGIKNANSTDLQIETLSRTLFSAWQAYGFDWLIGFDTSLETAGKLQDQSAAGTGDEVSRTSIVTGVPDPPGWVWPSAAAKGNFLPFM